MNNLGKRWEVFLSILFDPWTIMLIICVSVLFSYSIGETNQTIASLLFVLITAASTILGGRVTKHWVEITEGGIVVARGKSAVRSLKLLLRNISALEQRVSRFGVLSNESEINAEVTKRNYEEIQGTCNILEEEAVNSIENWTDIVPEADIKTQIGLITELKQSLQLKEDDLNLLNNELSNAKGKSEDEKKRLESEVIKKEAQVDYLEREIIKKKVKLNTVNIASDIDDILSSRTGSSSKRTLRIPSNLYEEISSSAETKNLSVSQWISDALKHTLDK